MSSCSSGGQIAILAAALASALAQGRTAEEIALLSSLFNVLGDNLALIAAQQAFCSGQNPLPVAQQGSAPGGSGESVPPKP